jgi:hypothetical protein
MWAMLGTTVDKSSYFAAILQANQHRKYLRRSIERRRDNQLQEHETLTWESNRANKIVAAFYIRMRM